VPLPKNSLLETDAAQLFSLKVKCLGLGHPNTSVPYLKEKPVLGLGLMDIVWEMEFLLFLFVVVCFDFSLFYVLHTAS